MSPELAKAFEPPTPSSRLTRLGRILPGVRRTAEQIPAFAEYWRAEAEQALTGDGPFLAVIGDSLGQGIGADSPADGYANNVRAHVQAERGEAIGIVNLSRSGAVCADVLSTQIPALLAIGRDPVAVLCTVGSNDLMKRASPGRLQGDYRELLQQLPPNSVVATLPSAGSVGAKLVNRRLRELLDASDIGMADVGRGLTSWRGRTAKDRFHPNAPGYEIWTQEFVRALGSHIPVTR